MRIVPVGLRSLVVLAAALIGCADRPPMAPGEAPPSFFPLAIGYRWTYSDTLITSSGTFVGTDTVSVVAMRWEPWKVWYRLNHTFNPSIASREFMTRNDSVYSLQLAESQGGPAFVVSLEYIRPEATGTLTYRSLFSGDALLIKSVAALSGAYTVAAGTFTGCAMYEYRISPEQYREILAPGIGIVSWEVVADSSFFGPALQRRRRLVSYRVGGVTLP